MAHPFDTPSSALNRSPLDEEIILSGEFWGELRVFLAVAKAKSLNRAALILNTSQPKVARQVRRLQDMIGSQLFVPTKRGVRLTAKGEELAKALARLDQNLFALSNDLKAETSELEGIVRMSVTDGLATVFVVPALRRFSQIHPRIQVHLTTPLNLISLRENQTDMMLGFSPVDAADITCRQLGTLHFIPMVSKDYVTTYGLPTSKNLKEHMFVQSALYSAPGGPWGSWTNLAEQGHISHYCDNSIAYGMLVKAGLGIGLLGNYNVVEPTSMPLELGVHIALPLFALGLTERLASRPVRLTFDWLSELFSPLNPWFAEEMNFDVPEPLFSEGYRLLFNL